MLIPIIINTFKYFIFAIFIYSITGRRFKLSAAISLIPVVSTLIDVYQNFLWWEIILLTLIPYLISQIALMLIFKEVPISFNKMSGSNKRWMKKDNKKQITPINYDKKVMLILIASIFIISVLLSILSIDEKTRLISIVILALLTITGLLIRYIILNKYERETIVIALGSNKDKLYQLDITNKNKRLMIEDVYENDIYFSDYIGQIDIEGEKSIRKHIYLISSNDLKEIDQGFELLENDDLRDVLSSYTRYNKTHTKIKLDPETNKYIIIKKRILK